MFSHMTPLQIYYFYHLFVDILSDVFGVPKQPACTNSGQKHVYSKDTWISEGNTKLLPLFLMRINFKLSFSSIV